MVKRRLIRRIARIPGDDTSAFGGAAWVGSDGYLHSIHLTDDPRNVLSAVSARRDLVKERTRREKYGDLGPGLYASAAPQLWGGRVTKKWDFLNSLTRAQRGKLAARLARKIGQQRASHYISAGEKDNASRIIRQWLSDSTAPIHYLADQPYNIAFWKPDFLQPLGIQPGQQARWVEIAMAGNFAELNAYPAPNQALALQRRRGVHGAFTKSGFSSYPQIVIWDNRAILNAWETEPWRDA